MTSIPGEQLRQAAEEVGRETGARLIALFGSAARCDTATPEDLDIAILPGTPLDVVALTNRFIRLLGVQHVDVSDLRRANPVLLALVARDGIPLYEATPGEFSRFCSLAARRYADTRKFRDTLRREIHDLMAHGPTAP